MPNIKTQRHTLRLSFQDRMFSQDTATRSVWKEDAKLSFPSLRSVHSANGEIYHLPRKVCPLYRECRHVLKVLFQLQIGLSDSRPLLSRALYRLSVRGAARDDLIGEIDVTAEEGRLLWPWAPGMRCLNNDEASHT